MSSYVLMLNGVRHSVPITLVEAERRKAEHIKWGVTYDIVPVEEEVAEVVQVQHGPAEVVEDVGCAGGACTL